MRLQGKTALVTAAGQGIGKATALKVAAAGATTIIVARGEEELFATRDEIIAARTAAGQPVDGPLDPPLPPVDAENLTEDIADNLSDDTLDPRPA